jgi:hypothetical protein
MPVYSVSGPDGYIYDIEGPENANPNAILNAAKRFARERELAALQEKANAARTTAAQPPAEAPRTTFGGSTKEFFKGLVPGAVGLGESAATGLAALLPEEQEKSVRSAVSGAAEPVKELFKPAAGYEESVGRKLGEAVGSTIPFFGLGALGVAGRIAAGGAGIAAGAGESREAAEAKGATPEERRTATLLGAPTGLLDIIAPEAKMVKTFLTKELGPIQAMMATAVKRGGYEGATEAAQKISQNLIAKGVYDPEQPLLAGSGEEGAYGAGAGALASLILDMTVGRKARLAQFPQKPAAPTEEKPKEEKPLLLGNKPTPFTPVVFPDGSVATSPEDVAAYEKEHLGKKFSAPADQPGIAGLLENKPFTKYVFPDGSVATTPEEVKAHEEELFKQRYASQPADQPATPGVAGLLENKPFTKYVFPDGSVANTPEEVKAYEAEQFGQKYESQPAEPRIAGLLENKPFTKYALPDGSVANTREELDAYEKERFGQKYEPQPADQPAAPGIAGLLENKPFTRYVLPDGSVANTREELDAYEKEQFARKYAPQPSDQALADQAEAQRLATAGRGPRATAQPELPLQGGQVSAPAQPAPVLPTRAGAQGVLFPQTARELAGAGKIPVRERDSLSSRINNSLIKLNRNIPLSTEEIALLTLHGGEYNVSPEQLLTARVAGLEPAGALNAAAQPSTPVAPATGTSTSVSSKPAGNKPAAGTTGTPASAVATPASTARKAGTGAPAQSGALRGNDRTKLRNLLPEADRPKLDAAVAAGTANAATAPKATTPKAPKTTAPATAATAPKTPKAPKTTAPATAATASKTTAPKPAAAPATETKTSKPARSTRPRTTKEQASANLAAAVDDLGSILGFTTKPATAETPTTPTGKGGLKKFDQAQKAKLIPTLVKLFDAALDLGMVTFKESVLHVKQAINARFGRDAVRAIFEQEGSQALIKEAYDLHQAQRQEREAAEAPEAEARQEIEEEETTGEEKAVSAWQELATPSARAFHDQISHAYRMYDAKEVGDEASQKADRAKVQGLLRKNRDNPQTNYFSKMKRLVDNLRNIAFDIAFPFGDRRAETKEGQIGEIIEVLGRYKRSVGETTPEANFFSGMGHDAAKKAAEWVYGNLSLPAQVKLQKMIAEYTAQNTAVGQAHFIQTILDRGRGRADNAKNEQKFQEGVLEAKKDEDIDEALAKVERSRDIRGANARIKFEANEENRKANELEQLREKVEREKKKRKTEDEVLDAIFGPAGAFIKKFSQDMSARLGLPLHPAVQGMLMDGNLKGALDHLAANNGNVTGKIANFLSQAAGTTKVEVTDNLVDEADKPVPGYFNPKTNTVHLDSVRGMNAHVLLHEVTHSALSHELDNPSSPHTRQLTKLFDDLKPLLGKIYAAQDVHEFTSEAWSNMEFRQKLNSITVSGGKQTAWDRFTNKVSNWLRSGVNRVMSSLGSNFRLEPKLLEETALSAADRLIETLISPSPETRNVGVLYKAAATKTGAKVVAKAFGDYGKFSTKRPGAARTAMQFFQSAKEGFFTGMYRFADLQTLVDVAKGKVPEAQKVLDTIRAKARYQDESIRALKPVVSKAANWAKNASAELYERFNTVVYGSTLSQVDPSKPRSTYEKSSDPKKAKNFDPEKLKEYDRIKPDYDALGKEGQEIYRLMRNAYRELYKKIEDEIGNRIDDAVKDADTAKKLKENIFKKLVERGGLEPYFPLVRKGKYRLSYNAEGEVYIEHFETKADRDAAIKELHAMKATEISPFLSISEKTYRKAPPTSFVNQILTTMEAQKVDPAVIESVIDLYLNTMPETSFARQFHARQGTLGFKQDAVAAMQEKVFSTSAQIANIKYSSILGKLDTELQESLKKKQTDEDAVYLGQQLRDHISESMNPTQLSTASRFAAGATYAYTLGFNLSSALIQTAQLPIVVYTNFGGKYGYAQTAIEMTKAMATFSSTGFTRKVSTTVPLNGSTLKEGQKGESITIRGLPSLDNVDFDKVPKGSPLKSLETLARVARSQNALARSGLYDVFDAGRSDGIVAQMSGLAGLPFHMMERFNRQVSMITAYNLELKRLDSDKATDAEKKMTKQQKEEFAANQAIYLSDLTNGGNGQETASLMSRQSEIGHVTTMYKRYGASMYRYLFKTMQTAYKDVDSNQRAIAQKQIAGVVGMSALLAGVQGVPMFDIAAAAYNTLWKGDDEDDFETVVRKMIGESYYKGLLTHLTGSEIGSRIGFNGLLYRSPRFASWSDDPIKAAVESLGGPAFGVAQRIFDGAKKVSEGEVERGIEQMLPTFLSSLLKANRYDSEGFKTLRGDEVVSRANGYEVAMQMIGFAPQRYMEQIQQNTAQKAKDKYVTTEKTRLLRQLYVAMRESDSREYDEVMEKLRKLGEKHPGTVTADTIISSLKANAKTSAEMFHGITLSKAMRAELMEDASEYSFSDDELED